MDANLMVRNCPTKKNPSENSGDRLFLTACVGNMHPASMLRLLKDVNDYPCVKLVIFAQRPICAGSRKGGECAGFAGERPGGSKLRHH